MSRLGELLVSKNVITTQQLQTALEDQKKNGVRLGYSLTKLGYIGESDLTNFLSKQYGVPSINLSEFEIDPEVIKLIPKEVAMRQQVMPVSRAAGKLIVAMSDPTNIPLLDDLKFRTSFHIEAVVASEAAIEAAIKRYYEASISYTEVLGDFDDTGIELGTEGEELNIVDLEKQSGEAPVIKLVNLILVNAIKKGASDIHIEPYEKSFRVRYRVDGLLYEEMNPPLKLKNAITSRLKIMAQLDIAERRLPQDGRIKLKLGVNREMDFRVSVLPTLYGEKVVMRLLDKGNLQLDMTKLGFETEQLNHFLKAIHSTYGMTLVTGPTGSGKTTTLYSALADLNKSTENISTAEDPVEFNLPGINQVQMLDAIGLNFATALRSFLRQDPDIIMVGEIRDFETAEIAVKAALTGHMVLSTLHTNDAPSTISRLLNMGIEPFLVTASVNLILAQRLVRKVCKECTAPFKMERQALLDCGIKAEEIGQYNLQMGKGCGICNKTGYKGRIALYEVMPFNDTLKELVLAAASTTELKTEAVKNGMKTLRASALSKVKEGQTTIAETLRVTAPD